VVMISLEDFQAMKENEPLLHSTAIES